MRRILLLLLPGGRTVNSALAARLPVRGNMDL